MRENIVVLGATGSIGRQTLDLLKYSSQYNLVGLSLCSDIDKLEEYLPYFDHLEYVAIVDKEKAELFRRRHEGIKVLDGEDCNLLLLEKTTGAVLNSIMGTAGLLPSIKALSMKRDLLLSNKESIVMGASLLKKELEKGGRIFPIDSEHVALAKLLSELERRNIPRDKIRKLVVTASGGALRNWKRENLSSVAPKDVLSHPTWSMGRKITVDSATMVNKSYEIIEASFLFSFPLEMIDSLICEESLIHALIEYEEEGEIRTIYEFSPCDMKISIAYALSKGRDEYHHVRKDEIEKIKSLHIREIDNSFYPLLDLSLSCYKKYGEIGMMAFDIADSMSIDLFLEGKMSYLGIEETMRRIVSLMPSLLENTKFLDIKEKEKILKERISPVVDPSYKGGE